MYKSNFHAEYKIINEIYITAMHVRDVILDNRNMLLLIIKNKVVYSLDLIFYLLVY